MTALSHGTKLPPHAESCLLRLWGDVLDGRGVAPTRDELRSVAREVSVAARQASMLPEQLLVAVKECWGAHEEFRDAEERHRVQWVLTDLISLCIREFYRDETERAPGEVATVATMDTVSRQGGAQDGAAR